MSCTDTIIISRATEQHTISSATDGEFRVHEYIYFTHADFEGLDSAVQQLNEAEQVRFRHVCYHSNSASVSRQTPCPQLVTEREPGNTHRHTHTTTKTVSDVSRLLSSNDAPPWGWHCVVSNICAGWSIGLQWVMHRECEGVTVYVYMCVFV